MRLSVLTNFPLFVYIVISAPWMPRDTRPSSPDNASLEHCDRPDMPRPGMTKLQLPISLGHLKVLPSFDTTSQDSSSHQQHRASSLTGSTSLGAVFAAKVGSLEARETIQALHRHIYETVNSVPKNASHEVWNPVSPEDNLGGSILKAPNSEEPLPTTRSILRNGVGVTSLESDIPMPDPLSHRPVSFSVKSLPSDISTAAASTKSGPAAFSNTSGDGTLAITSAGCVTTVLALHPHRCKDHQIVYNFTKTVYKSINCHGCTSLRVLSPMYGCPMITSRSSETIRTATTPYVWTSTVCETLTAWSQMTDMKTSEPMVTTTTGTLRQMGMTTPY